MKLVDYSKPQKTPGFLQNLIERLQSLIPFWPNEQKAHARLVAQLQGGLDHRFFLLKNTPLPGLPEPVPYILIGPPGLTVLNVNTRKGIYRAKDESWWEMSKTLRQYQPSHPNLIKQTQGLVQRLTAYLDQQGRAHPPLQPVLVFTDPGVHVESSRPAVRIVLADGMRRLASTLMQSGEALQAAEVRLIADTLDRAARPGEAGKVLGEGEDYFGKDLIQPVVKKAEPSEIRPMPQLNLQPVEEKMGLSRKQWIVIALMATAAVLVLGFAIFYVLSTM